MVGKSKLPVKWLDAEMGFKSLSLKAAPRARLQINPPFLFSFKTPTSAPESNRRA